MKYFLLIAWTACVVPCATGGTPGTEPRAYRNIPLWEPATVPGAVGDGPLDAPFLTVFAPRAGTANGGAVLIAPGGGNIMLMYGGEGADVAEVFNDWGITAFVLTYRLSPRYDNDARTLDGERAMRLVARACGRVASRPGTNRNDRLLRGRQPGARRGRGLGQWRCERRRRHRARELASRLSRADLRRRPRERRESRSRTIHPRSCCRPPRTRGPLSPTRSCSWI